MDTLKLSINSLDIAYIFKTIMVDQFLRVTYTMILIGTLKWPLFLAIKILLKWSISHIKFTGYLPEW